MRATEYGLLDEYRRRNQPFPDQCINSNNQANPDTGKNRPPRMITLQNLMGPFTIIIIGYVAALATFTIEKICFKLLEVLSK